MSSLDIRDAATFLDLTLGRAATQGDDVAYTFLVDGEDLVQELTFARLHERASRLAGHLRTIADPGDRALLLFPPGIEYAIGFWACMYAGVIAVPAYPPDPMRLERTLPRLVSVINDSGATVALSERAIGEMAEGLLASIPGAQDLTWIASDDSYDAVVPYVHDTAPDSVALLQYTSGSTGDPKGVCITHGNMVANSHSAVDRWHYQSTSLAGMSWLPYHDMGLMSGLLSPQILGSRTVLMSPLSFLAKPMRWLRAMSNWQASFTCAPNFAFDLCTRKATDEEVEALDLSSWEVALCGAEPIRAHTMRAFAERFAPAGFDARTLLPAYGLAEVTVFVSATHHDEGPTFLDVEAGTVADGAVRVLEGEPAPGTDVETIVPSGHPGIGTTIMIVDPATGEELAEGAVGEICIDAPGVAAGYWNRPEETAACFPSELAGRPGRWVRTGDLGAMVQGQLVVAGRIKDLVIIHGRNHYPQDIELSVERAHPALRPGCGAAFAVDTPEGERLAIVQELDTRDHPDVELVIDDIRRAVVLEHDVTPWSITLVKARSIPKTSSGKIQRNATRQALLANDLEVVGHHSGHTTEFVAPRTELERLLAEALATVLQLPRVGVQDDFFELGGTSLHAAEFLALASDVVGEEVTASELYATPTVEAIAAAIDRRRDPARRMAPGLTRVARDERVPATPVQHWLWQRERSGELAGRMLPHVAIRLDDMPEKHLVEEAFQRLAGRHDALAARFRQEDGGTLVLEVGEPGVTGEVLTAAGPEEESELVERVVRRDLAMDGAEPLFGWSLVDRSDAGGDPLLVLWGHPAIVDQVALQALLEELGVYYQALQLGAPAPLAGTEVGFRDWTAWVAVQGTEPAAMPGAGSARHEAAQAAEARAALEPAVGAGLRALARRHGVSPFSVAAASVAGEIGGDSMALLASARTVPRLRTLVGGLYGVVSVAPELTAADDLETLLTNLEPVLIAARSEPDQHAPAPDAPLARVALTAVPGSAPHLELGEVEGTICAAWGSAPAGRTTLELRGLEGPGAIELRADGEEAAQVVELVAAALERAAAGSVTSG